MEEGLFSFFFSLFVLVLSREDRTDLKIFFSVQTSLTGQWRGFGILAGNFQSTLKMYLILL